LPSVAIIDYGMGNLHSIEKACKISGFDTCFSKSAKQLFEADLIILPGVGAFGPAMDLLKRNNLIEPIKEYHHLGKPLFGICLGMQLLFTKSFEGGEFEGLGLIEGSIVPFRNQSFFNKDFKIPHISWNQLHKPQNSSWNGSPLESFHEGEFMYFMHSYYVVPAEKESILSWSTYGGINYCSSVSKNNIFGVQFHPEKSGEKGLQIYKQLFSKINKEN